MSDFVFGGGIPGGYKSGLMNWRGEWSPVDYTKNDVVRDGAWAMVANKDTADRAAPQPVGSPFYVYTGVIGLNSQSAKQVIAGNRYTIGTDGWITGYRVFVTAGNRYSVFVVLDPLGLPVVSELANFTANNDGWVPFNVIPISVETGTQIDLVYRESEPDPTPTTFAGNWNYTTPNNAGAPATGTILHSSKGLSTLAIHKTDNDAADRSVELGALDVGDIISGAGQDWVIQTVSDDGAYFSFSIAPASQGTPTGVQEFTFETVTATPIIHAEDVDYWLGNSSVSGLFIADGDYSDIVADDTAYGTDIEVQEANVSDDWDMIAYSSAGASGGVGQSFPMYYEAIPLVNGITVNEGGPPTLLNSISIDDPVIGRYRASIGIIADFQTQGDQITWRTTGLLASTSDFTIEAKSSDENEPFFFELTIDLDGSPVSSTIEAEVTGPGQSDVTITRADIFLQRIG